MFLTIDGRSDPVLANAIWLGRLLTALVLYVLVPAIACATDARTQIDFDSDPVWALIEDARDGKTPTSATDGVRYLLVLDQVNLTGPKPVWHRRLVYEVDQQRGLASAGQFGIEFHPQYQRVRLHAIDVWRDGVRNDRRAQSRIEMLRRESELEAGLLDGQHTLSVTIPDLRVGDRIDYRFSIVGYNPVFGRDYYDVYTAGYSMPLAERRVRFVYPQATPLRWRVTGHGYEVRKEKQGTLQILDIASRKLPRVTEESTLPAHHDAYGKLQFSTAADWAHVARWASPLYPARFSDRELAGSLARKLGLDPADKEGSLIRAIAFAQGDIRYTGLDMGQNSHAPNPPELTVERRFGDCKDKSTLLVALLAEAGIPAEPVLVNTIKGSEVGKELPGALAFNHVVVRARHDGRYLWIDPTRDRERGPLDDREPLSFGSGLPIHDPAGRLVAIPQALPDRPLVDVEEKIALALVGSDASAVFHVATAYAQGHAAGVRENFAANSAEEVGKQYLRYMGRFYDGIRSSAPPSIVDSEERDLVRTVEQYRVAWSGKDPAFGIVLFQLSDWLPELDAEDRQAPLALSGTRRGRQTIRTSFGQGWSISAETDKVANRYFSFERDVRVEGKDLVIRGEWRRFADEVPARDYDLVRRDFAKARELLTFDVDLDTGFPSLVSDFPAWHWPLASMLLLMAAFGLAWRMRASNAFAGMLFRPYRTMAAIGTHLSWRVVALLALCGVVEALCGPVAEYLHQRETAKLAAAVLGIAGYAVRLAVATMILRWAFKLLSVSVAFRNLFVAGVWSISPPSLILMGCALVAVGGNIEVFADKYIAAPDDLPGIAVSSAMAGVAIWWMLVSSLNAYAAVTGTSRGRVAAAMGLVLLALLTIFLPIGLLAYFK